jgi:hypothetical protein
LFWSKIFENISGNFRPFQGNLPASPTECPGSCAVTAVRIFWVEDLDDDEPDHVLAVTSYRRILVSETTAPAATDPIERLLAGTSAPLPG